MADLAGNQRQRRWRHRRRRFSRVATPVHRLVADFCDGARADFDRAVARGLGRRWRSRAASQIKPRQVPKFLANRSRNDLDSVARRVASRRFAIGGSAIAKTQSVDLRGW